MKKVFISLPMHGLSDDEVLARMEELKEKAEEYYGEPLEMIDTYFKDFEATGNYPRLMYLGDSISKMAEADFIFFASDWQKANGCRIEMLVADNYCIPVAIENPDPLEVFFYVGHPLFVKEEYRDLEFGTDYFPIRSIHLIRRRRFHDGEPCNNFYERRVKLGYFHGKDASYFLNINGFGMKSLEAVANALTRINKEHGEKIIG